MPKLRLRWIWIGMGVTKEKIDGATFADLNDPFFQDGRRPPLCMCNIRWCGKQMAFFRFLYLNESIFHMSNTFGYAFRNVTFKVIHQIQGQIHVICKLLQK